MPTRPAARPCDPEGYYARLGLEPAATQAQIAAAFRARARVLHPDVPRTGNAEAFVVLKRAYDVLSHPDRRAAYDREATAAAAVPEEDLPFYEDEEEQARHPAPPGMEVSARMPRFSDLPALVWLGMGALLAFTTFEAVTHLYHQKRAEEVDIQPTAPVVAALPPGAARSMLYGPAPVHLPGPANFYVTPADAPATLWRLNAARGMLVTVAQLPAFSTMHGTRLLRRNGLLEVTLTAGLSGYVAFDRVIRGDLAAARRAYCSYNAGPAPQDGEVLERRGGGAATLTVENRSVQPAVLKLRDAAGGVVLSVFLNPYGNVDLSGLPGGSYRPQFATGDLWSRACNGFAAGMHAVRLDQPVNLPAAAPLVIAPQADGLTDIPDQAFERE